MSTKRKRHAVTYLECLRRVRGLTLAELAEHCSCSLPTVWKWECATATPAKHDHVVALQELFPGWSMDELVENVDLTKRGQQPCETTS